MGFFKAKDDEEAAADARAMVVARRLAQVEKARTFAQAKQRQALAITIFKATKPKKK